MSSHVDFVPFAELTMRKPPKIGTHHTSGYRYFWQIPAVSLRYTHHQDISNNLRRTTLQESTFTQGRLQKTELCFILRENS